VQTDGGAGARFQASIAYIINPTATVSGDIVANWVTSSESIIEAIALDNVGGVVGSNSGDSSGTANTTLNYTTTLNGGFVVGSGLNNTFNGGAAAAPQTTGLSTDLFRDNVSGNFAAVFAYSPVATAGSYSAIVGGTPVANSAALIAFDPMLIPEPSSIALMGLGGLALYFLRRR